MILGVDHLALSCADIGTASDALRAWRYRAKFIASDLPNPEEKRSLLRTYDGRQSLAYCIAPSGLPIELTRHEHPLLEAGGFYEPLMASEGRVEIESEPAAELLSAVWRAATERHVVPVRSPLLKARYWHDVMSPGPAGFSTVLARVPRIPDAERFWVEAAGCRRKKAGETAGVGWTLLELPSVIQGMQLRILLAEQPVQRVTMLDDPGFNCLALLTSALDRDVRRLAVAGRSDDVRFSLTVNDRPLRIAMLRSPGGGLVELIEFAKPA